MNRQQGMFSSCCKWPPKSMRSSALLVVRLEQPHTLQWLCGGLPTKVGSHKARREVEAGRIAWQQGGEDSSGLGRFGSSGVCWILAPLPDWIHLHGSTWTCTSYIAGAGPSRSTGLAGTFPWQENKHSLAWGDLWKPKLPYTMQWMPHWCCCFTTWGVR